MPAQIYRSQAPITGRAMTLSLSLLLLAATFHVAPTLRVGSDDIRIGLSDLVLPIILSGLAWRGWSGERILQWQVLPRGAVAWLVALSLWLVPKAVAIARYEMHAGLVYLEQRAEPVVFELEEPIGIVEECGVPLHHERRDSRKRDRHQTRYRQSDTSTATRAPGVFNNNAAC